MRVLYIADVLTQSGAIKSFEEVVITMKKELGIDVIVCTSGRSELNDRLELNGIQTIAACYGSAMVDAPITWWKAPIKYVVCGIKYHFHEKLSISQIENALDLSTIDLIHTNINRIDVGVELARKYRIPNIMHIREFGKADFRCWSYRKNYIQFLDENVTHFIAISDAIRNSWVTQGLSLNKIDVIYNGVDSEQIKSVNWNNVLMDSILKMVIVGGVIPNKGQVQAIEAISLLPEEIKNNVKLDIIGWSSKQYFNIVKDLIKKYGLENQIRILGVQNDVGIRLQEYHIGLMCSKAEGFGRVTAEYMHAGLGVIGSNCGANPELIQDGVTGLLYNKLETYDLTKKIIIFYQNRELLVECAKNGKKFASTNFTRKINASNILKLYKEIISSRKL